MRQKIKSDLFKVMFVVVFIGFPVLMAIGMKDAKLEAQSNNRPIPIGRYEFPQDGVVCYRSVSGTQGVSISCVKVR